MGLWLTKYLQQAGGYTDWGGCLGHQEGSRTLEAAEVRMERRISALRGKRENSGKEEADGEAPRQAAVVWGWVPGRTGTRVQM